MRGSWRSSLAIPARLAQLTVLALADSWRSSPSARSATSAAAWLTLLVAPLRASLSLGLVVFIGGFFLLFDRELPGGQTSLLERCHLLQQGFFQTLRHSFSFRTHCASRPISRRSTALIILAKQYEDQPTRSIA